MIPNKTDSSYAKIILNRVKQVGEENGISFPFTLSQTIRPIISRDLKKERPNYIFRTIKRDDKLLVYLKEIKAPFGDQTSGDLEPNN